MTRFLDAMGMRGLVYTTLAMALGALVGLGVFTFGYAEGTSYLGHDSSACANCHAMNEHYDGWQRGSHRDVAGCSDCHSPHDNLVLKYANKAENGFWHSLKFTTGDYPENIRIREHNKKVTEAACLYCHGDLVHEIESTRQSAEDAVSCLQCHNEVGHKR